MSENKTLMVLLDERFSVQEALEQAENPAELIEQMDRSIQVKAAGIALYLENCDRAIDSLDSTIKQLQARKKVFQNRKESLKGYALNAMQSHGITKIESPECTIRIQKNPPSVDDYDPALIPDEYWEPQPPKLKRKELLEDLKAGVIVQGAVLKQSEGIRIS